MMERLRKYWLLLLILLLAGFLRLYHLAQTPPSPSLDEVSTAWNAYSILKTGQDEYGTRFPVLLRAYDDWRPAGCTYLTLPFVGIFGLSAIATRLPFVILSMITILAVYFLVKELFHNLPDANRYALIATFLLAISPWHLYISRLGHDTQAGLTLSVLAILFFVKAVNSSKKSIWFLLFSAIFWVLSFYTYQSQKIFGPLMILALGLIYREKLMSVKKEGALAAFLGLLLLIPIIRASLTPEALLRFSGTSIFSPQREVYQLASLRTIRNHRTGDFWGLAFDNQRVAMGILAARSYLSHFDPTWLFFNGGEERHKIPGLGVLYFWELPLLLMGIYKLMTGEFSKRTKFLLLSWILIAPLPAAITTDAPHAMRAFNLLPVPQVVSAIGIVAVSAKLKKLWPLAAALILVSLGYLYHNYFVNFPFEQSASFQYPLGKAIPYVLEESPKYDKVVFSNQNNLYQSYMFFLFYSRYDPKLYQSLGGTFSGGFAETHQIGKYEFRPINWLKEEKAKTLFVGNFNDFPPTESGLETFALLNEQPVIKVVAGE